MPTRAPDQSRRRASGPRTSARLALAGLAIAILAAVASADQTDDAWTALVAGGHVALIRHGNAPPGHGGDPPGFRFDDCSTQRNMDEVGREQARAVGDTFRRRGVRVDRVLASPVCRCVETAELMAVGHVERAWALVPDRPSTPPARILELKEMAGAWRGPGTLVLVTHGFTIQALLGFVPAQAETVVVKPAPGSAGGVTLVGRIPTPAPR